MLTPIMPLTPLMPLSLVGGGHAALPVVPKVNTSTIRASSPDGIYVVWDRPMHMTCDITSQITVTVDGTSRPVARVEFDVHNPSQMAILMGTNFKHGEVVTWAYDDTGSCDLQEVAPPNTEADNQTYGVANNIVAPTRVTADSTAVSADSTKHTADEG